jgi:hypothetical protein
MTTKFLLFVGLCFFAQLVYGQTASTTPSTTDTATQKQLSDIKDELAK